MDRSDLPQEGIYEGLPEPHHVTQAGSFHQVRWRDPYQQTQQKTHRSSPESEEVLPRSRL
jgi:hypothetical protein